MHTTTQPHDLNPDLLALDHHNRIPIAAILEKHEITIARYRQWLDSPDTKKRLNDLEAIDNARTPTPGELRRIAIQGLIRIARSDKLTEPVRKACHDLRQLAAEVDDACKPRSDEERKPRTFTKEQIPFYLHHVLDQINDAPWASQPGNDRGKVWGIDYWGFDPDDPASIRAAERQWRAEQ